MARLGVRATTRSTIALVLGAVMVLCGAGMADTLPVMLAQPGPCIASVPVSTQTAPDAAELFLATLPGSVAFVVMVPQPQWLAGIHPTDRTEPTIRPFGARPPPTSG